MWSGSRQVLALGRQEVSNRALRLFRIDWEKLMVRSFSSLCYRAALRVGTEAVAIAGLQSHHLYS